MKEQKRQSERCNCVIEPLEDRLVMSAPLLAPPPMTIVLEPVTIIPPTYTQNYHSRKGTYYAGDYYWGGDRKIRLGRATDELVIGLAPEAISGHLLQRRTRYRLRRK